MTWLALGLLVFLGIHTLPHFQLTRQSLIQRLGAMRYKGLFTLISATGLAMIVIGVAQRHYLPLWHPPAWSREFTIGAMLPASVLLCSANFPNNIQRLSKHPMLIGLLLWSASHLLANGDLASLMLFGGFLCFAVFDLWSVSSPARLATNKAATPTPVWRDLVALLLGVITYAALLWWHGQLFAVALVTQP